MSEERIGETLTVTVVRQGTPVDLELTPEELAE
jgi:hypothetical protein